MRKAQKQEILNFIGSLHQAHEEIKGTVQLQQKNRNLVPTIQNILQMLSQCQEFAISLGENIEKTEGEGHITVSCVEEYCELLFRIYEEIEAVGSDNAKKNSINENKIYKALRKQLIKIENSVKNDIITKKEVVFFPYQASMWDSLESVYFAAKEDPNCDVYCVPIPYYNLKSNHSFGEMHYEGNQYPKNIEITDWKTYRFEERMPDEIYIHNAYDDWNLVTSVHPRFYSGNLKKYTETLVYIPYFILGEIEPDNQEAIEGMKHFCFMPGIINADRIIVQSEKMKQIYVNEYLKAAKKSGLTGKHLDKEYLNKKFLGLGSPKIDKILNTKKEDLEIPEEWMKVIRRTDGSWKKIVLYNTSVGVLLANSERWIDKLEAVLKIFYEYQDEIALLWRPHPLIETTMQSMRPDILPKYIAIKDKYLKQGWGIFDNTSNMHRAILISDAYFGDGSSVAYIYQATHKPVMIQNSDVNKELYTCTSKKYSALRFENLYDDGSVFWFTAYDFNALFKMDKNTWNAEYMGMFPAEEMNGLRLYADIVEYKDRLYFTPMGAKEIGVYDKKKKEFLKIPFANLNIAFLEGCQSWNFYSAHIVDGCIYFMPHERTAILKYDIENNRFTVMRKCISDITAQYSLTASRLMFKSILKGKCIYAPISGCNLLERIDVETGETKVFKIGDEGTTYFDICCIGNEFIIVPLQGEKIIIWSENNEKIYSIVLDKTKLGKYQFCSLAQYQNSAYAVPYQYGAFLTLRKDKENIGIVSEHNLIDVDDSAHLLSSDSSLFEGGIVCTDGKMYICDMLERKLIEYDINQKITRKEQVVFEENTKRMHMRDCYEYYNADNKPQIYLEVQNDNLLNFLYRI